MGSPLRLFVAWVPSASTRRRLAAEVARVVAAERQARGVVAEDLHATCVFLGSTPAEDVPSIVAAVREVASRHAPFAVEVRGLGAFPSADRPRVVWAGLAAVGEPGRFERLAVDLAETLASAGHVPHSGEVDARERFHPHVTLARVESRGRPSRQTSQDTGSALEKLLTAGALQDTYTPELVSDVRLMVSESQNQRTEGPATRYRALAVIALGESPQGGITPGGRLDT